MVTVQNSNLTYSLIYDSKHRLTSKTDSRLGLSESWGYDPAGNIHNKTDYQGNVTTYQYDDSNRLTAETNAAYLEVSYHYDPAGRLLDRILSNGAKTSYTYDTGGRLRSLVNTAAPNPNNTIVAAVINSTTYTRDAVGNILTALEAAGTSQAAGSSTFTYDPVYRLLTATYPTTANNETIAYDPVGNRTKYTKGSTTLYYNVNAANRYTTTNTTSATGPVYETYTYDKNGSLTNITGNRTLTLTWDAHNRASQIQVGAITPYSYQYDINSYRIAKNLNTIFNNYYLENGKLESIYDNNGNVQAKYMRGSVIDEVVNGYQLNSSGNMTNYTYHHDSLESVLGQSGNTGAVVAAQGYTSFGSTVNATGSSNNTLKFTGREQDAETGLYYYRARYYDPITGRFLSEDPIRSGINYYAYCRNNPINCRDPSGLRPDIDTYSTPVAAAIVALLESNAQSIAPPGAEYSGAIYQLPGENAYRYTAATSGDSESSSLADIPDGAVYIDIYHTHGDNDPEFIINGFNYNNIFSPEDIAIANASGKPNVMIDPSWNIHYYNPNWSSATKNKLGSQGQILNQNGSTKPIPPNKNAANQAANAAAAAVNSAMDAVNSAINPPSVPQAAPTATLTTELIGFGEDAADGGFILYPNMSNTNQIQSVYSKH